jgi:hypothetical protein
VLQRQGRGRGLRAGGHLLRTGTSRLGRMMGWGHSSSYAGCARHPRLFTPPDELLLAGLQPPTAIG